jgi:hypothetical protein
VAAVDERIDANTLRLADVQEEWKRQVAEADDEESAAELLEVAKELARIATLLRKLREDVAVYSADYERREAWERNRAEAKRRREEARLLDTAFTDAEVLGALKALLRKNSAGAVWAGDVARRLGALPTQSDRVRAGQALSRLARKGEVAHLVPRKHRDRRAHLWSLPDRRVSDWALQTHREVGSRG